MKIFKLISILFFNQRFDEVFDTNKRKPKLFGSDSKYKDYLDKKFTNLNPVPKWATKKNQHQLDSDDEDLDRTAGDILSKKFNLQHGELDYKHCVAINRYDNLSVSKEIVLDQFTLES